MHSEHDFKERKGPFAKREDRLVNKRKVIWKKNVSRMNQSNLRLPDSKAAANRAIVIKRKSARNRAAANRVAEANKAASRAAVSKADDKSLVP